MKIEHFKKLNEFEIRVFKFYEINKVINRKFGKSKMGGKYMFKEVWAVLRKHGWQARKKNRDDSSYDYFCGSFTLTTPQLMPWAEENNILVNTRILEEIASRNVDVKRKRSDEVDREKKVSVIPVHYVY